MAKEKQKKIKNLLDYKFEEQLKILFGFTSGRLNKYLYFNVPGVKNSIVTTNGNYDLIASCSPVTLAIHLITFTDVDLYNRIVEFFNVPSDKPYVVRMELILKAFMNHLAGDLVIQNDINHTTKITTKNNDTTFIIEEVNEDEEECLEDTTDTELSIEEELEELLDTITLDSFPNKDIFGAVVNNVYSWCILVEEVNNLNQLNEDYFISNNLKYIKHELNCESIEWYTPLQYRPFKVDKDFFDYPNRDLIDCYVLCLDGQDAVSTKSFIKKVDGVCTQYAWSHNKKTIKCMAVYEDSNVVIKSIRPFYEIIPIIRKESKSAI